MHLIRPVRFLVLHMLVSTIKGMRGGLCSLRFPSKLISAASSYSSSPENRSLSLQAENLGLLKTKRHIFLCADQTKPKCCNLEAGLESWDFLKKRLKELNLVGSKSSLNIQRTKANCLQLCQKGPISVVYPDGVW